MDRPFVFRRRAFLFLVLLLLTDPAFAQSVSKECPGYPSDGPYPTFSSDKMVSWDNVNLQVVEIMHPSLEVVEKDDKNYFKVGIDQFRPKCKGGSMVSGHLFAEIQEGSAKLQEVNLGTIQGSRNYPDPPTRMEWTARDPIRVAINPGVTMAYLSFDCDCRGGTESSGGIAFRIPVFRCDENLSCDSPPYTYLHKLYKGH